MVKKSAVFAYFILFLVVFWPIYVANDLRYTRATLATVFFAVFQLVWFGFLLSVLLWLII